jgi:hypothetical protein
LLQRLTKKAFRIYAVLLVLGCVTLVTRAQSPTQRSAQKLAAL